MNPFWKPQRCAVGLPFSYFLTDKYHHSNHITNQARTKVGQCSSLYKPGGNTLCMTADPFSTQHITSNLRKSETKSRARLKLVSSFWIEYHTKSSEIVTFWLVYRSLWLKFSPRNTMVKTNKFQELMHMYSDNSQRTSKYGMNISCATSYASNAPFCYYHILTGFEIAPSLSHCN